MRCELLPPPTELHGPAGQWPTMTIAELLQMGLVKAHKDGNHGSLYPRVEDFGSEGVPFLTAKLLSDGRVDVGSAPRLANEKADKLRLGFVHTGDVLLSHNATIGRVAIVPAFTGRLLIGTSLTYFRLDEKRLLPQYLAAYFNGQDFQNQLKAVMSHTTRNQVPITAQRLLRVVVPPMEVQQSIASTLGLFDTRIDLLRQTNATLESIAQALFKSWFIDFDPVRAKAEGREPDGMDAATAALFPAEFEESELGLIPKGWSVGILGDMALLAKGSVNPMEAPSTLFEHYSLPAFDAGKVPIVEEGDAIRSNKTRVPKGAVLQSKLNPHIPRVWLVGEVGDHAVCSTEFVPWVAREGASPELIYCALCSPAFGAQVQTLVTGTSNSHQRVKPDQVASLNIVVAPSAIARAFTGVVRPMFGKVAANRLLSRRLVDLRDTLLPRLISGKLRLPEVDEKAENVLP